MFRPYRAITRLYKIMIIRQGTRGSITCRIPLFTVQYILKYFSIYCTVNHGIWLKIQYILKYFSIYCTVNNGICFTVQYILKYFIICCTVNHGIWFTVQYILKYFSIYCTVNHGIPQIIRPHVTCLIPLFYIAWWWPCRVETCRSADSCIIKNMAPHCCVAAVK